MSLMTLEEVCIPKSIVDGPFGSNLKLSDYCEAGVPVLQGKNITGNEFKWFDVRFISEAKAEELKRSSVREGDVLIVKIGSIGYSALVDNLHGYELAIIPANLARITPNPSVVDTGYLLHLLRSDNAVRYFQSVASKTAQPALSLGKIKSFAFDLPPIEEQKRIAAILDKADSLRRKRAQAIALADDFLRATFLDMFGDPVTNPKGWDLIDLGDLVEINPRIDRNKINVSDEVVFLPMAAVAEQGYVAFEEYRPVVEVTKGFTYFERGDVLFAKITPCMENGKAAYLNSLSTDYGFGSTEFHVLRPGLRVNPWFIFYLIWNNDFRVKAERSMKGAAGQKRVGADYLRSFKTHLPPKEIQDRFGVIVERVKQVLNKSNFSLAEIEQLSKSLATGSFLQAR